jgi:peptidoglycan hydrolase FlgJ
MSTNSVAVDLRSLDSIRLRANTDPKAAVKDAARQFETLFMNELMKSMRATTMDDGLMSGGQGAELATGMLDQQFAGQMSGLKGGLSEAIMRQLERQMGLTPGPIPATGSANNTPIALGRTSTKVPEKGAAGFVQQHTQAAEAAAAKSGIPATFMIAQAAHETGWGRKEIKHADGSPAFNLFGIKAGPGWNGPTAEITTTEVIGGVAHKVKAKFRAYSSYAESFADYAKLMTNSPRYQHVAKADTASEFARGLQKAGYATDPHYADKLTRVIDTTLRLQRTLG